MKMLHALVAATALAAVASAAFNGSSCGVTKGCFPADCDYANGLCGAVVSYGVDGARVRIELARPADESASAYVAVGFSTDASMGDDYVAACVRDGLGAPTVRLLHTTGHTAPERLDETVVDANVKDLSASSDSKGLYCSFTLPVNPTVTADGKVLNLDTDYHLLLAEGPVTGGSLGYHAGTKQASSAAVNVVSDYRRELVSAAPELWRHQLKQAHGCLMIVGWWMLSAVAILSARYYKHTWPDKEPCGTALWFALHRGFNAVALVCIVAAAACIVTALDWTYAATTPHHVLGLIAAVLAVLQPVNALFRCGVDDSKRIFFNWIHRSLGLTAWVLAAVTIYLATDFESQGLSVANGGWTPRALMYAYWAVLGLAVVSLEAMSCAGFPHNTAAVGDAAAAGGKAEQTQHVRVRTLLYCVVVVTSVVVGVVLCAYIVKHTPADMR